jgi:membrane-bound lytic murein transglycosylase D
MNKKMLGRIFWAVLILGQAGVISILILGSGTKEVSGETDGYDQKFIIERVSVFRAVEIPDSVTFAGEPVPVDRFDVRESLDRELLVNSYFHSQTLRYIKLAPRFFPIIEPILAEKGIPDDFKYLAVAESGFNLRAVSSARAIGLWQFMLATAGEYGLEVNSEVDERYHVEKSTYAACNYLLRAYRKYGNWSMVAASYNGGMAGVERQMVRQKSNSYYNILFGEETGRYVYRIIALKLIMENPEKYNFVVEDHEKYPYIPTREVEIKGRVANLADFAIQQGINYKLLKDFNPWLRDNQLTNSAGKRYTVKIPILEGQTSAN